MNRWSMRKKEWSWIGIENPSPTCLFIVILSWGDFRCSCFIHSIVFTYSVAPALYILLSLHIPLFTLFIFYCLYTSRGSNFIYSIAFIYSAVPALYILSHSHTISFFFIQTKTEYTVVFIFFTISKRIQIERWNYHSFEEFSRA